MINKSIFERGVQEQAYWTEIERNKEGEAKYFKQPFEHKLYGNQLYCEVMNDRFIKPCPICGKRPEHYNTEYKNGELYAEINHTCHTDKFDIYMNFACRCKREHEQDAECELAVYNRWNEVVEECEQKIKEKKESLKSIDI